MRQLRGPAANVLAALSNRTARTQAQDFFHLVLICCHINESIVAISTASPDTTRREGTRSAPAGSKFSRRADIPTRAKSNSEGIERALDQLLDHTVMREAQRNGAAVHEWRLPSE